MPLIAKNDYLIDEILTSDKHRIDQDGTCWIIDARTKSWRRWDTARKPRRKNTKKVYREVNYKCKHVSVHRIVYAKFVGKLDCNFIINHIDGNPSNNKPENLELVTQSQNNFHAYQTLNKKPVIGHSKITKKVAQMIRQQRKLGANYSELMSMFGLCKSTISYVVNKKTWS